ncbi:MAG: fatty acid desaturase [Acetobacteraceae bacterium]|nr:fatty acid desaturase [Acetobacteraceae bacterium]
MPTEERSIPGTLNLVLLAASTSVAGGLLWIAAHSQSGVVRLLAAVAFSFVNNTIFSLMHEAVHGIFHSRPFVNEIAGHVAAAFFPTAFSLQRAFHLTHHRNNRGELERFDYYSADENRLLKFAQWYSLLTGLYWLAPPAFCVAYAASAGIVPWTRLFSPGDRFGRQTSAAPFLESLNEVRPPRVRFEVVSSAALQLGLIYLLDLDFAAWALCYACFAVNWSSLQYADHAFSPLDQREGAWNLRVNLVTRLIFLNYHHHLVHHRAPGVSWLHLPKLLADGDPNPSFWSIYRKMWAGPQPLPVAAGRNVPNGR